MVDEDKIIKDISICLYDIFVVNSGVIGLQMPDGKYIPQIFNYDYLIFEKMLRKKMSLGIYQQQYYRNVTKWICLDFDCQNIDDNNLPTLIEELVNPCIELLEKLEISYLLEFSGRRGVHIWIIFDTIISKSQAFKIVSIIKQRVLSVNKNLFEYAIDIFPKIAGGVNKYGSMVKCPLSWHKRGKQSFLMINTNEFITATGLNFKVVLENQLKILQQYKKNDYHTVCKRLNISQTSGELNIPFYKKQYLIIDNEKVSYSFFDIESRCTGSSVFKRLFENIKRGTLSHLDRLILVSTFSHFNEELLYSFFELQNNYNYQKTKDYTNKYKTTYYPISMKYLYDIYNENLETDISPEQTTLEFICKKLNISQELIQKIENSAEEISSVTKVYNIVQKEISYMKYNDEILDVVDYYKISNFKKYDLEKIDTICQDAIENSKEVKVHPFKYYVRIEKNDKPPRKLVSLSPYDRVITSYLVFELSSLVNWRFDSFSYNVNLLPHGDVFFPWFHSWKKFNEAISMYVNAGIFDDLSVIKVDIKNFYDNIYFHAIYDEIIQEFKQSMSKSNKDLIYKINNIFKVLCKFNDKIMLELTGNIKGVPQGPAYARVIAEVFIASVVKKLKHTNKGIIVLRYVDDMFILHDTSKNSTMLLKELDSLLLSKALELNKEKTRVYGQIATMSAEDKIEICEANSNYSIKTIKSLELESPQNRENKIDIFKRFVAENNDWKKDANFILNEYIENDFIDIYLKKYYKDLICSTLGRGSIFNKFYMYITSNNLWFEKFLNEELFKRIPPRSLNMKSFLNILFDMIIENNLYENIDGVNTIITFLLNKEMLDEYEENFINVINRKWKDKRHEFK